MTLYIMINVPYIRDEIKRLGQKYVDSMEEYPNVLATNLMKEVNNTPIKKKTTSRVMYLIVL